MGLCVVGRATSCACLYVMRVCVEFCVFIVIVMRHGNYVSIKIYTTNFVEVVEYMLVCQVYYTIYYSGHYEFGT